MDGESEAVDAGDGEAAPETEADEDGATARGTEPDPGCDGDPEDDGDTGADGDAVPPRPDGETAPSGTRTCTGCPGTSVHDTDAGTAFTSSDTRTPGPGRGNLGDPFVAASPGTAACGRERPGVDGTP